MRTILVPVSLALLSALTLAAVAQNSPVREQAPVPPKENRSFLGPIDPAQEAARALAERNAEKNYQELKDSATELADLSKKLSEEIERGSKDVISFKVFDNLDKIEKLTKRIRDKARGPN